MKGAGVMRHSQGITRFSKALLRVPLVSLGLFVPGCIVHDTSEVYREPLPAVWGVSESRYQGKSSCPDIAGIYLGLAETASQRWPNAPRYRGAWELELVQRTPRPANPTLLRLETAKTGALVISLVDMGTRGVITNNEVAKQYIDCQNGALIVTRRREYVASDAGSTVEIRRYHFSPGANGALIVKHAHEFHRTSFLSYLSGRAGRDIDEYWYRFMRAPEQ